DPSIGDKLQERLEAVDRRVAEHLETATNATRRPDLEARLIELRERGLESDRIRDEVLADARTDRAAATALYLQKYLPTQETNHALIGQALALAAEEVSQASRHAETKASETQSLAWTAIVAFVVFGVTGGVFLTRSVRRIVRNFEEAAAEVRHQRDEIRAI